MSEVIDIPVENLGKAIIDGWAVELTEDIRYMVYYASDNAKVEKWTLHEDDAYKNDGEHIIHIYTQLVEKVGKIIRIGKKLYRLMSVGINFIEEI